MGAWEGILMSLGCCHGMSCCVPSLLPHFTVSPSLCVFFSWPKFIFLMFSPSLSPPLSLSLYHLPLSLPPSLLSSLFPSPPLIPSGLRLAASGTPSIMKVIQSGVSSFVDARITYLTDYVEIPDPLYPSVRGRKERKEGE